MSDTIVRAMAKEIGVLALVCHTTDLVNEGRRRHEGTSAVAVALGYGLTAVALLGAQLKVQQRIALKVQANGPLQKMVVEGDSYGRVRGYVEEPALDLSAAIDPLDTAQTIGHVGLLTVVKDVGLRDLYEGVVPIQTGRLDSDLVYYLTHSEQVPSLVEIGVKLGENGELQAAGGLLLAALPGQDLNGLRVLAERLDDLAPIGELIANGESPQSILAQVFGEIEYEVLEESPLQFECSCSWPRSEQALIAMGREELEILIEEGQAVVDCHFCRERYIFGREALEMILERATS